MTGQQVAVLETGFTVASSKCCNLTTATDGSLPVGLLETDVAAVQGEVQAPLRGQCPLLSK